MRKFCCSRTLAQQRALYVAPLVWNRTLMPRILTCAFNEAILLHLLCLVALTCVCVLGEFNQLAGCAGLHVGLSLLALAKSSINNHLFQVLVRPTGFEQY